jgi:hypothetical protein
MGLSSIDSSIEIFKSILDSGDQNLMKKKGSGEVEELEKVLPLIGGILGTIARVGAAGAVRAGAGAGAAAARAGAGAATAAGLAGGGGGDDEGGEPGGQPPPIIYDTMAKPVAD